MVLEATVISILVDTFAFCSNINGRYSLLLRGTTAYNKGVLFLSCHQSQVTQYPYRDHILLHKAVESIARLTWHVAQKQQGQKAYVKKTKDI